MRIIDTHAHLDFPDFNPDRESLIQDLAAQQIGVITIATDQESIAKVDALSKSHPLIWGAIGLHPTEIGHSALTALPELIKEWGKLIAANPKIIAIGEIGLDYFHNREDETASRQKAALRQMLTFAEERELPVIFHCREAYGDLITLLRDYQVNGVVHCFSGNQAQAETFLERGLYLSATAIVTYPKNEALRQVFTQIPADRLMLETDSPFLPLQEKRGQRNDPTTVEALAKFLAELRGQSVEALRQSTTHNAETLFKLEVGHG